MGMKPYCISRACPAPRPGAVPQSSVPSSRNTMGAGDGCGPAQGVHLAQAAGTLSEAQASLWPRTALTQAYYVGTAGAVSAEIIRRYIQECPGEIAALPGGGAFIPSPERDGYSRAVL